jgi:hypothetical protein
MRGAVIMDKKTVGLHSITQEEAGNTIGYSIERRVFIRAAPMAIAALALASPSRMFARDAMRSGSSAEEAKIDFDDFVKQCLVLARAAQQELSLNEEAHIFRLSEAASRLRLTSVPKAKLGPFVGLDPPVEFGPIKVVPPLAIIQWRLSPGAVLPPHNHNPADVISLCLEGDCTVRHFEIVGTAPEYSSKETFLVRESRNDLLTPGRMSSLSTIRDYIHTFKAGNNGAMGIDINSILPGDKPFSFLEIAEKAREPQKRIYEAVWRKL